MSDGAKAEQCSLSRDKDNGTGSFALLLGHVSLDAESGQRWESWQLYFLVSYVSEVHLAPQ